MYTAQHTTRRGGKSSKTKGTEVFNSRGQVVGNVKGDTFYKEISGSRHFLRSPAGIANDTDILRQVESMGARNVAVRDRETHKVYRASIEQINKLGVNINRGYGAQIVLLFSFWNAPVDNQPALPLEGCHG